MSDSTWAMIKQHMLLRRAGQLCRAEGQCMQRAIHAALKRDRAAHTAQVGELIVAEFAEGNVHKAFPHLKGWNRNASKTQAKPCFHTMERQMLERVELYRQRDSPGPPIIINNVKMLTKKFGMILPLMGKYGWRLPSSPMAAARECRKCGRST